MGLLPAEHDQSFNFWARVQRRVFPDLLTKAEQFRDGYIKSHPAPLLTDAAVDYTTFLDGEGVNTPRLWGLRQALAVRGVLDLHDFDADFFGFKKSVENAQSSHAHEAVFGMMVAAARLMHQVGKCRWYLDAWPMVDGPDPVAPLRHIGDRMKFDARTWGYVQKAAVKALSSKKLYEDMTTALGDSHART